MSGRRRWWTDPVIPLALVLVGLPVLVLVLQNRPSAAPMSVTPETATSPSPTAEPPGEPARSDKPDRPGAKPSKGPGTTGDTCVDLDAPRLSVVTFNIHSGLSGDRRTLVLARTAQAMKVFDADVYLLQEVDKNRLWSRGVDEASYLADQLGMSYAFGPNVARSGQRLYGTAILSRFPVRLEGNTALPNQRGMQQRGLLHVTIEPHGVPVSLYVTHLEHTSAEMRLIQARAIAQAIAGDDLPKIVGGDMNARPLSPVLGALRSQLRDTWTQTGSGAGLTHPAWRPRSRIDYLLYDGALTPLSSQVLSSGGASDHLAVRSDFALAAAPAGQVCVPELNGPVG